MYACNLGTGRAFLEGLCTLSNTTANLHNPPLPPHNSRIYSRQREPKQRSRGQIGDLLPRSLGRIYEVRP